MVGEPNFNQQCGVQQEDIWRKIAEMLKTAIDRFLWYLQFSIFPSIEYKDDIKMSMQLNYLFRGHMVCNYCWIIWNTIYFTNSIPYLPTQKIFFNTKKLLLRANKRNAVSAAAAKAAEGEERALESAEGEERALESAKGEPSQEVGIERRSNSRSIRVLQKYI